MTGFCDQEEKKLLQEMDSEKFNNSEKNDNFILKKFVLLIFLLLGMFYIDSIKAEDSVECPNCSCIFIPENENKQVYLWKNVDFCKIIQDSPDKSKKEKDP